MEGGHESSFRHESWNLEVGKEWQGGQQLTFMSIRNIQGGHKSWKEGKNGEEGSHHHSCKHVTEGGWTLEWKIKARVED